MLREGGKHADELMILPNDEIIIVEQASKPDARDGRQALETLRKLVKIGKRFIAVIIVAKKEFDRRDKGLIAQALTSECQKYRAQLHLLNRGQKFRVRNAIYEVVDC